MPMMRPYGCRVMVRMSTPLADTVVVSRVVRLANHASAAASLAYFGLVSSTMQLPNAHMPMMATLASVITRNVGPTTNAQFAANFGTLVTPAGFVFLIWPFIAALQLLTLAVSILRPAIKDGGPQSALEALNTFGTGNPLSQTELASLSLANAAATTWVGPVGSEPKPQAHEYHRAALQTPQLHAHPAEWQPIPCRVTAVCLVQLAARRATPHQFPYPAACPPLRRVPVALR